MAIKIDTTRDDRTGAIGPEEQASVARLAYELGVVSLRLKALLDPPELPERFVGAIGKIVLQADNDTSARSNSD